MPFLLIEKDGRAFFDIIATIRQDVALLLVTSKPAVAACLIAVWALTCHPASQRVLSVKSEERTLLSRCCIIGICFLMRVSIVLCFLALLFFCAKCPTKIIYGVTLVGAGACVNDCHSSNVLLFVHFSYLS